MTKILEALSSTVGALVNRSFVTAGLVPAILLYGGWSGYRDGWSGVRDSVQSALAAREEFWATFGWTTVVVLLIAWLFVALKGVTWAAVTHAPLGFLRYPLVRLSLRQRDKRQASLKLWLGRLGPLRWSKSGSRFVILEGATKTPEFCTPELTKQIGEAKKILLKKKTLLLGRRLSRGQIGTLADCLKPLWDASKFPTGATAPPELESLLGDMEKFLNQKELYLQRLAFATDVAERSIHRARLKLAAYPRDAMWVRPTRFGNRLAAIDDYAERRYGIDTSTMWTRLWGVLGEGERTEFQQAERSVAALLNIALALFLLGMAAFVTECHEAFTLRHFDLTIDWTAFALCLGAAGGSYLAYSGAVSSLGGLGEVMARSIDLKRLQLLKALGFDMPSNVSQEIALFRELQGFFTQGSTRKGWRKLRAPKEGT